MATKDSYPPVSTMLILDFVPRMVDKWKELAILLGQENTAILLEVSMSRNLAHNLLKIIKAWIDGGKKVVDGVEVSPTWDYLLQVLQNPIIDKGDIANEIRRKITPVSCSPSVVIGRESSSHLRDQVMPVLADLTVKTEIHQKIEPLAKTLGTWEHPDFKRVLNSDEEGDDRKCLILFELWTNKNGWELKELLNALNSDEVNLKGIARNIQDSLNFES